MSSYFLYAKETANQKRKRGRPAANASRDDADASQTQLTLTTNGAISRPQQNGADENDAEEEVRPKKRGRKANKAATAQLEPEPEQAAPDVKQPPKKKRGRPSLQKTQQAEEDEVEEPPVEESKPKRRGRPAATTKEVPDPDEQDASAIAKNQPPKKRGRPSLNRSQEDPQTEKSPEASQNKKRGRGRRPAQKNNTEATADEADNEGDSNSSLLRRSGRGKRKPKDREPTPEAQSDPDEVEEEPDGASSPRKGAKDSRLGRPSKKGNQEAGDGSKKEDVPQPTKKKKMGRPSLQSKAPEEDASAAETGKTAPSRRGRKPVDKAASNAAPDESQKKKRGKPSLNQNEEVENQKPQRGRKNRQAEQEEQEDAEAESAQENESSTRGNEAKSEKPAAKRGRRRRNSQEDDARSQSSSPEPAPYRQLTTRTRKISREVIQERWSPLDSSCVEGVTELLQLSSRPVFLRLNNLKKQTQATAALNAISNKLRSKLTRGLPFPPATTASKREDELSYERTLDGIQSLEAQLDPLLHSVALLQKEKERAEKELDQEYKLLNTLSANARSEIRGRRDQLRKIHPLVPELKHDSEVNHARKSDGFCPVPEATGKTFVSLEDEELQGLAGQLGNHMESMRGNLQQIEGIAPAIAQGRSALKLALLPHLDQDTFEQVLLG
ncbi:Dual specificity mitogen-activated protein kinase kinase 4 [Pestalotiopsis sp. IQ-011]